MEIDRIHRLGKGENAPVIVRFNKYRQKEEIWRRRKSLTNSGVSMSEDFPEEVERKRKRLYPIMKEAIKHGMEATLSFDKLIINSQAYTVDTLSKLPPQLQPERISHQTQAGFTFFFSRDCPLSNFYPATFTINGHTFNCAEQFIQHSKAVLFNDQKTAQDIIHEPLPEKQKQLGRQVTNFNAKLWEDSIQKIVTRGLAQKFEENNDLKTFLRNTGSNELVEASPRDTLFGIGLGMSNEAKTDKSKWRGKILQGQMLQKIRSEMS